MPTQQQIQDLINEIQTGANYPATKMNPLLSAMLDFASAGQTQVYDGLVANNTTASTTLILQYGVNIIDTSTLANFACKLPQPVTGKRVVLVNKSTLPVFLYPSNVGGQINNYPVDTPALVPPDGKAYDFVCIENPLPGAWVWSPPATNQYDSGELSLTTTSAASNNVIMAASSTFIQERQGFYGGTGFAYNGLNNPLEAQTIPQPYPNTGYLAQFKPPSYWNAITKIKVYTNIKPPLGVTPNIQISCGSALNLYLANTTTLSSFNPQSSGTIGQFNISNLISGVASPGLSANIGDPGTAWDERTWPNPGLNGAPDGYSIVGDFFVSTDGALDTWYTKYISFQIAPKVIGNVKFRFFIEYF